MDIEFTIAEDSDSNEILNMMAEFYAIDEYPFDRQESEKQLLKFINNSQLGRIWLLKVDAKIIGYIVLAFGFSFEFGGRDAFIDEFYIREPFRGKGFGTQALQYVEQQAKNLDVKALHLEVENQNTRAAKLYSQEDYKLNEGKLMTKRIDD